MSQTIAIPDPSLVVLVGPAGSGKTTFARRHFGPTEVVSSDQCRELVSDAADNQRATPEAFDVLHAIVSARLSLRRLTVVDATNLQIKARTPLIERARRRDCPVVAVVFDLPEAVCHEHNRRRADRQVEPEVIAEQHARLRRALPELEREGFRARYVLRSIEEIEAVRLQRGGLGNSAC